VEFGDDQSLYYRQKIEAPWFAYWLKDKGPMNQPEAMTFQTGRNSWERYEAWPPKRGIENRKLHFAQGSGLSFDAPRDAGDTAFDSYVSDPARPVPYRQRRSRRRTSKAARPGRAGWCRISASLMDGRTC
jgi:predicted acyl esterase